MATTRNEVINKADGWVEVATDPTALSMTANTPGVWYVAIASGAVSDGVYGERMGDYDSYMTGEVIGTVYVRVVGEKVIKFGITEG